MTRTILQSPIASILLTLLALTQTNCSTLKNNYDYTLHKNIIYKTTPTKSLTADIYAPIDHALRPAVLVVHGGSWSSRSGDMESICKDLAKNGFVAINITYRLAPQDLYPAALEDVRDAITWVKTNAEQWKIHPENISGWGYSSGAHLILLAAIDGNHGLKKIVAGGTPADLMAWPDSPLVKKFIGHTSQERPDLWKAASPINHITEKTPPIFLYHGEWDNLVEIDQMHKLTKALDDKKRGYETYSIPFMGHIMVYFLSQSAVDRGITFLEN